MIPLSPDAFALDINTPRPVRLHFDHIERLDLSHDGHASHGHKWAAIGSGFKIIATIDDSKHGVLLHVSVSHTTTLPPWSLMIAVKRHFFPADVAAAMIMPEEEVYVNSHPFCLHIWQLPEKWDIG